MATTQSDMPSNEQQSHKTTVREFLRENGAIPEQTHLTGTITRGDAAARVASLSGDPYS